MASVELTGKIDPKNNAFTGLVDAKQIIGGVDNKIPPEALPDNLGVGDMLKSEYAAQPNVVNQALMANRITRYYNTSNLPYIDLNEVLTQTFGERYQGLTVNVAGTEFWFKDGIDPEDLVVKSQGGGSGVGDMLEAEYATNGTIGVVDKAKEIDNYYNNSSTVYTNTAEVLSQIIGGNRKRGLTVNVAGVEYWFKDGVNDNNLVVKIPSDIGDMLKSTYDPNNDGKIATSEISGLATVATSGSYADLSNKPINFVPYTGATDDVDLGQHSLNLASTLSQELPTLGSELLSNSGWTLGGGWTGDFTNGFTNNGTTGTLSNSVSLSLSSYIVQINVTSYSSGSYNIRLGTSSNTSNTSSDIFSFEPTSITGGFGIITSNFIGTIKISLKLVTGVRNTSPVFKIKNSVGQSVFEILGIPSYKPNQYLGAQTIIAGNNSGSKLTNGQNNISFGYNNLNGISIESNNTAFGYYLLNQNKGSYNSVFGSAISRFSTSGDSNSLFGYDILTLATSQTANCMFGDRLFRNINNSVFGNSVFGSNCGYNLTNASDNNCIFGNYSAMWYGNVSSPNLTGISNSILIGSSTRPLNNNGSNEIVIGTNAVGNGSNTVTIGNASITDTYLKGVIHGDGSGLTNLPLSGGGVPYTGATQALQLGQNQFSQQSTTLGETPAVGGELLNSSNWTSTGWTGTYNSFTHTVGNTTPLSNSYAATTSSYYKIAITMTGRSAGYVEVTFGGSNIMQTITDTGGVNGQITTSKDIFIYAILTNNLVITPTTDFNGTIAISLKQVTGISTPTYFINDTLGNSSLEIRNEPQSQKCTFVGRNAGGKNGNGVNNTFFGHEAGRDAMAFGNTAVGSRALQQNTKGSGNTATGIDALQNNTIGSNNTAYGNEAHRGSTVGDYNVVVGNRAMYASLVGSRNVAVGYGAGYSISGVGKDDNVFVGNAAGRNKNTQVLDGQNNLQDVPLTQATKAIFIGANARGLDADNQTNEIVIGADAKGNGSNTTTIGNDSTTDTYLRGIIHGDGIKLNALQTSPISAADTGTTGEIRWDANYMYVCVATNTWKRSALTTW